MLLVLVVVLSANVLYLEQPVGVGYSHVTEGTAEVRESTIVRKR